MGTNCVVVRYIIIIFYLGPHANFKTLGELLLGENFLNKGAGAEMFYKFVGASSLDKANLGSASIELNGFINTEWENKKMKKCEQKYCKLHIWTQTKSEKCSTEH